MSTTRTVTSKDGTRITYDELGEGAVPLILVDGAFCHRAFGPMPDLAPLLAQHFRVIRYDRRGRGDSTDVAPYAVEREVEDIRALADAAGAPVYLYGTSSGAMLALRAAASGLDVKGMVLFEPPLALDGRHYPKPADFREQIDGFLKAGRRSQAAKLFMKVVGMPAFAIFIMQLMPKVWRTLCRVAHTLPYDFALLGETQSGGPLPPELEALMRSVGARTRLVVGGKSPPWMHHAAKVVAGHIPGATVEVLPGQAHNVAAKAVAPVITAFLGDLDRELGLDAAPDAHGEARIAPLRRETVANPAPT